MAKRTRTTTKTTRTTTSRAPRATSRKTTTATTTAASAPGAVEVVEERHGIGFEAGVVLVTTILLLVAILFLDAYLGTYDKGLFF